MTDRNVTMPEHQFRCSYCKKPSAVRKSETSHGTVHFPRRHKNIAGAVCPGCQEPAHPIKKT